MPDLTKSADPGLIARYEVPADPPPAATLSITGGIEETEDDWLDIASVSCPCGFAASGPDSSRVMDAYDDHECPRGELYAPEPSGGMGWPEATALAVFFIVLAAVTIVWAVMAK